MFTPKTAGRPNVRPVILLATALAISSAALPASAATRKVPGNYGTIQAAINGSSAGDTIVVAAGTYNESLNWASKNLTIQGAGIGQSVISGAVTESRGLNTVGLSSASSISGFTFYRCVQAGGGAILNTGSSLRISNCRFTLGNSVEGAGVYNAAGSNPTITSCTFDNNIGGAGGAALAEDGSSVTLVNCVFYNNRSGLGGAVYLSGGTSSVVDCVFYGNSTLNAGPTCDGGAIAVDSNDSATFTNCTIADNSSSASGGAIFALGKVTLNSCIVWGNTAAANAAAVYVAGASPLTMSYTDMQGATNTTPDGNHNFGANPMFVNAAAANFQLLPTSPCINRGNDALVTAPPFATSGGKIVDIGGAPRTVGGYVDQGAYELQPIADVTSQMNVIAFPPQTTTKAGVFQQVIMLTNVGKTSVSGPIYLAFSNVVGGTLLNGSGVTNVLAPAGRPYINMNDFVFNGTLPPGIELIVVLNWSAKSASAISFTPQVVAGPGPL